MLLYITESSSLVASEANVLLSRRADESGSRSIAVVEGGVRGGLVIRLVVLAEVLMGIEALGVVLAW